MELGTGAALRRVVALLLTIGAYGCASGGKADIATLASNSDQIIWEAGQKAYEKKQWEPARQYFKRIVEGFPQSEHAPAARLALADSHFSEGGASNYVLAISEYRDFVTLYPSHPRSDYAQMQIGDAYFRQRHGPDRDQTFTIRALAEYERLLEAYPSSPLIEQSRERIAACRQSLARAEFLAGYFYQRTRKAYRAATSRYEWLLTDYPDYEYIDEVLFRLAQVLQLTGRATEAMPHLAKLVEVYPSSQWADNARALMKEISESPPASAPGAPASPTSSPSPAAEAATDPPAPPSSSPTPPPEVHP